jgi:hypothetical protein
MILTAYIDESGTHGGSPVSTMAAYLADARQWRKYEKRARKLFARFRVTEFHMVDVRRGDKDFSGWSVDRKIDFLDEFQLIINDALECGVASFLSAKDYEYYFGLEWHRKARKDSQYCVMFRACMSQIISATFESGRWNTPDEPRLHIVIEEGHRNVEDVARIYRSIKEHFDAEKSHALAGLTTAGKDCLPLAAADLLAYSAWAEEVGAKPIGVAKKPSKADASFRQNLYKIVVSRNEILGLFDQGMANITRN